MKLSLSENISKLRKESSMTQEQLAEALGVTFASVSKWERGVATPDLSLIAEMADLFSVSLDALVGFHVQDSGANAVEQRIFNLQQEKRYDEAITEAEKALLRYPNNFRIVYRCGNLYSMAGLERGDKQHLGRCIELLERSVLLLSQNTDPDISEISIRGEIAQSFITLGKENEGIDILKKYNVCGVYNPLIAVAYTGRDIPNAGKTKANVKEAEPYMMSSYFTMINTAVHTMAAYINYYYTLGDYASACDTSLWLIDLLNSSKKDPNRTAYFDKVVAICFYACAHFCHKMGELGQAEAYLRRCYAAAKKFDSAPTWQGNNLKFIVGNRDKSVAYDSLGESAIASVEDQLMENDKDQPLQAIWNRIIEEDTKGDTK
jgi:transcriptional regulator with XRE-family HTH domain